MRKEQFISFIDSPALQQGESVAQLSQLTKQFPYCQTAHLLLAKALHNGNSIAYSDQLKTAAAYVSDRKVLYQLIMSKAPVEASASIEKKELPAVTLTVPKNDTELLNNLLGNERSETSETEKKETSETEKKETFETQKKENLETVQKIDVPEEKAVITIEAPEEGTIEAKVEAVEPPIEDVVEPPAIPEEKKEVEPERVTSIASGTSVTPDSKPETENSKPETVNVDEISLLEKNILVEAIDASIELEVSENMPFRETEENAETEKSETSETEKKETFETEKKEASEAKEPEIRNPKLETSEEEELDPNKNHSFAEWLRLSQKAKAKAEDSQKAEEEKSPEEKEKPFGEKEKQAEETEKQPEEKQEPKVYKRKTLDDLIDKFITEEPKISRPTPKQEFFSPVNMARQSVQDDNYDFVTETLANIYLKQGSFTKAIKAYETLSLKFPEKKLYFAARIKEIKKIIKEQK